MTKSSTDSALAQEVVGCIEAINSGVKSASAELSSDFFSVSALSGADRTLDTCAQLERAARSCRAPDGRTHAWCGRAAVMVLVSSASGPRVSGCIRHFGDLFDRTPYIYSQQSSNNETTPPSSPRPLCIYTGRSRGRPVDVRCWTMGRGTT